MTSCTVFDVQDRSVDSGKVDAYLSIFKNAFTSVPSSPRPEGNLPRSRGELGMGGVKGIAVGASVTYGSNSALALCYIWLKGSRVVYPRLETASLRATGKVSAASRGSRTLTS